jgi:hypothetical protein
MALGVYSGCITSSCERTLWDNLDFCGANLVNVPSSRCPKCELAKDYVKALVDSGSSFPVFLIVK